MDKRLIDAEKLKRRIIAFTTGVHTSYLVTENIIMMINQADTVNTVEVVRCRDCRWRGSEQCGMFYRCNCGEQHTWETDDDFCSYGERGIENGKCETV